jgi:hypothetical protein
VTGPIDAITAAHNGSRKDMEGIDAPAFDALNAAVSAGDALATAQAAAAFKFHLDIHLFRQDTHLYRIFAGRVSVPDKGITQLVRQAVGDGWAEPARRIPELPTQDGACVSGESVTHPPGLESSRPAGGAPGARPRRLSVTHSARLSR